MSLAFQPAPSLDSASYASAPVLSEYHQMDRGASGYPQSGLAKPHTPSSEPVSQASADPPQRPHDATSGAIMDADSRLAYSSQAQTPTSEYGMHPSSARSATFPEHARQQPPYQEAQSRYPPGQGPHGASGGTNNDGKPLPDPSRDGTVKQNQSSDHAIPIDPSLARSGAQFPPTQYAYASPAHDIAHGYPPHPTQGAWRPEWPQQHPGAVPYAGMSSPYSPAPSTNVSVASSPTVPGRSPGQASHYGHMKRVSDSGSQMNQVYSFVPIPGAQQHKRPRRKFEEIERMYLCGWNGCQKAYGTLNHLNAHVTMQNHGPKRVPDEFKEIRREWKARKKEEELAAKKAEEDKARQGEGHPHPSDGPDGVHQGQHYDPNRPQLPPLNYSGAPQMGYYGQPTSGEPMPMYAGAPGYPPYPPAPYSGGAYPPEYHQPGGEYPPGSNPPPPPGPPYRQ